MTIKLYDSDGKLIDRLYQWDVNRRITLSFGETIEPAESDQIYFHFSNNHTEEAYSVKAIKNGERDYEVMIPNELFMYDDTIFMYIFRDRGANGRITIEVVKLPVAARSMPGDYVFKDSPGIIRIANGLVAIDNVVYLAKDGIPFGEGAEAASDVGFGMTGNSTPIMDGYNLGVVGDAEVVEEAQDLSESTWEQGYIDYTDGETEIENNARIRSDYISIPNGALSIKVKTTGTQGYQYDNSLYFYSETEYLGRIGWNADNSEVVIPSGSTRYRVVLGKTNGSAITWSEIASCIATYN